MRLELWLFETFILSTIWIIHVHIRHRNKSATVFLVHWQLLFPYLNNTNANDMELFLLNPSHRWLITLTYWVTSSFIPRLRLYVWLTMVNTNQAAQALLTVVFCQVIDGIYRHTAKLQGTTWSLRLVDLRLMRSPPDTKLYLFHYVAPGIYGRNFRYALVIIQQRLMRVFLAKSTSGECHKMALIIGQQSLIARFMGPTWDPSGADRTQVGPRLAPWTLLSGLVHEMAFHKSTGHS